MIFLTKFTTELQASLPKGQRRKEENEWHQELELIHSSRTDMLTG